MSKRILVIFNGELHWMTSPNIAVASFANNRKKITYLEIFYYFGQHVINKPKTIKNKSADELREFKRRVLLQLDNRIQQTIFFANEARKKGRDILKKQKHRRIHSYKPMQIFISYVTAYSDSLHILQEEVLKIDSLAGKRYSDKIWSEDWFKYSRDVRTLMHHIESPLTYIEGSKIMFYFENLRQMEQVKSKKITQRDNITFALNIEEFGGDIIKQLNIWAHKHLDNLDKSLTIRVITGFRKNGAHKTREMTLGELMKKVPKVHD